MNSKRIPASLPGLLLFLSLVISCRRDLSLPQTQTPSITTARAANETVNIWLTTADQSHLLQQQANVNFAADAGTNPTTITVDENTTFQTIDGFGYALTGGSASLINGLGANQNTLGHDDAVK